MKILEDNVLSSVTASLSMDESMKSQSLVSEMRDSLEELEKRS